MSAADIERELGVPPRPAGGRLAGRVAIVTGAGASAPGWSNGNAVAVAFAREGAAVLAIDRSRAAAEDTQAIIRKLGGRCEVAVADMTRSADVEQAVRQCRDTFGRIDILHNNVGAGGQGGPVETTEAAWHNGLDLNLTTAFLASKHVLPVMQAQGSGSIIFIGSIAGIRYPGTSTLTYSVAKAGLLQLSKTIALQYARQGIRSNYLALGHIDTAEIRRRITERFGAGRFDEVMAERGDVVPNGRAGSVWDVANAAVFLASDESAYITGTEIAVDGGAAARSLDSYLEKLAAKEQHA